MHLRLFLCNKDLLTYLLTYLPTEGVVPETECNKSNTLRNQGQSNLAKGDIADFHFGGRGLGKSYRQRWHHSKERWWFPIGSPL